MDTNTLKTSNLLKLSFLFAFVVTFTFLALRFPTGSTAASLDNFRPGNIISDYTMSNVDTMSVSDIQRFLSEKGNCNDTATYRADWYPSVHYHTENGHFVCLADERFATSGTNYGDLLNNGPSQTAAEIIYEVAHEYKINPQVLLVLLQKEQGLITDSWPNSLQYRSATGYGCPDTAACDSKYYGFKNQLKNAAALFRTVLDGGWTNYPLGENYIYYNPNRDCGGSTVNIENLATSSLYRYTPYQPNAEALAAGYGTVSCGAYGNRNFYLYFMDWFGDPTLTSLDEVNARISEVHDSYADELGAPVSSLVRNSSTNLYYIRYQNGYIVGNDTHGYYLSMGKIRDVWKSLDFEYGKLGFPISNFKTNSSTGIIFQDYEHGCIVGNDELGYYESMGKIRDVWANQGFESGSLGFPTGHIVAGCQTYEHGQICEND